MEGEREVGSGIGRANTWERDNIAPHWPLSRPSQVGQSQRVVAEVQQVVALTSVAQSRFAIRAKVHLRFLANRSRAAVRMELVGQVCLASAAAAHDRQRERPICERTLVALMLQARASG